MADVTGPIRSMPGSVHKVPEEMVCDGYNVECVLPATIRIQGETDSFGSEMMDLCSACHTSYLESCKEMEEDTSGVCDWCGLPTPALHLKRDFEEGLYGRIYSVCQTCIDKENTYTNRNYC